MKSKLFLNLVVFGVMSWTMKSFTSAASAKIKMPETMKQEDLSDTKHFDHGAHDTKYDHDAFLGEEDAAQYETLTPEQTQEKLKKLIPHIDIDKDKKISRRELTDWIETHMKKHLLTTTEKRMKEMDKNSDEKVTFDEYSNVEFAHVTEDEKDPEYEKQMKEMKERDKKRFDHADMNGDGTLSKEELNMMLHPEEYPHMMAWTIQDNMEMYDTNKDGVVSMEEYFGLGSGTTAEQLDEESKKQLSESFNNDLDKNKDGVLDKDEMKKWIMPEEHDPTKSEVTHLMSEADDDKDNYLSETEILHHHELFAGSRATRYGEILKGKIEL